MATSGEIIRFHLRTFGVLELHRANREGQYSVLEIGPKPIGVIAILAMLPAHRATRSYLAELMWPKVPRPRRLQSLREALRTIRVKGAREIIEATRDAVSLKADLVTSDLWQLVEALRKRDYARAARLFDGPFMDGLRVRENTELDHWIESQADRIRAGMRLAYETLASQSLTAGEYSRAIDFARSAVRLNPLHERSRLMLIDALVANGDRAGALQEYEEHRSLLNSVLDDQPSQELLARVTAIAQTAGIIDDVSAMPSEPVAKRWLKPLVNMPTRLRMASVAVLIGTLGALLYDRPEPSAAFLKAIPASTILHVVMESDDGLREVVLSDIARGGQVTGLVARPYERPSPDGRYAAWQVATFEGYRVAIRDGRTGVEDTLRSSGVDERPTAWSPDARWLGIRSVSSQKRARESSTNLRGRDMVLGVERQLAGSFPLVGEMVWSPRGDRIAFVGGASPEELDLFVSNPDASGLTNVTSNGRQNVEPAWSPNGMRLAYVMRRDGESTLCLTTLADTTVVQIMSSPVAIRTPVWLGSDVVAFVRHGDLWALDLDDHPERVHRVTNIGNIVAVSNQSPPLAGPWAETVRILSPNARLSQGSRTVLRADVSTQTGRLIEIHDRLVSWSVVDTGIAVIESPGWLLARSPGHTLLVASLPGWRADTVVITVGVDSVPTPPVLFREDWRGGIDTMLWMTFGHPSPYARSAGAPEGGYFVSNGDRNYHSGAATRSAFELDGGLAVEFWGQAPVTGRMYEDMTVGLSDRLPSDSDIGLNPHTLVTFAIHGNWDGAVPEPNTIAWIGFQNEEVRYEVPLPDSLERWNRYGLQVTRNGDVQVFVNGRFHAQAPGRLLLDGAGYAHVVLGFRSHDVEVKHGPIVVYRGVLYGPT